MSSQNDTEVEMSDSILNFLTYFETTLVRRIFFFYHDGVLV